MSLQLYAPTVDSYLTLHFQTHRQFAPSGGLGGKKAQRQKNATPPLRYDWLEVVQRDCVAVVASEV